MAAGEERRRQAVLSRVSRVRSHLNTEVMLNAVVIPLWVGVAAVLLWRFLGGPHVEVAALVTAIAVLVATRLLGRARLITPEQASVIADRSAGLGGLLLTRLEAPVGEWEFGLNQNLKTLTLPKIEVRRAVGLISLSLLTLVVGLLMPRPPPGPHVTNAAAAARVEQLEEKVEALAKEEPKDEATQAELERLKQELADSQFDAADWEAADSLDKSLDAKAAEAGAELSRAEQAAEKLQEALNNADAQANDSRTREQEELEKALMALSDGAAQSGEQAMQQAMNEGAEGKEGEGKQGQSGKEGEGKEGQEGQEGKSGKEGQSGNSGKEGQEGKSGKEGQSGQSGKEGASEKQGQGPGKSSLEQLKQALQKRQEQLAKSFGQKSDTRARSARTAGKGSGTKAEKGEGKGEGQGDGDSNGKTRLNPGKAHASHISNAGTGHGYEDPQELVFAGEAEMDPDRLRFEALPEGNGGEAEELYGLRAVNPSGKPAGVQGVTAGNLPAAGDQSPGNRQGPMLPRNRALIQRYFNSK